VCVYVCVYVNVCVCSCDFMLAEITVASHGSEAVQKSRDTTHWRVTNGHFCANLRGMHTQEKGWLTIRAHLVLLCFSSIIFAKRNGGQRPPD
jgi:hypothetical protein